MGAAANIVNRSAIVHAAYKDNFKTLLELGGYLIERQQAAKEYLTYVYEDPETVKNALFEHIQFCNKAIATILGIDNETNPNL
jgi:hypothetical protein